MEKTFSFVLSFYISFVMFVVYRTKKTTYIIVHLNITKLICALIKPFTQISSRMRTIDAALHFFRVPIRQRRLASRRSEALLTTSIASIVVEVTGEGR